MAEKVKLVWKTKADLQTPRLRAMQRIGAWPGSSGRLGRWARQGTMVNAARTGSPSGAHAAETWEIARGVACRQCATAAPQMVDLAMVSALARHLAACERCWRTGPLDKVTPAEWLTWGVRMRPGLWRVFLPVVMDMGIKRERLSWVPGLAPK